MNNDWNPELYLLFVKERTQPMIDLVSRIDFDQPKKILDVGCGPGNSTQILVRRWPDAEVVGVDNSPAMIEKAKKDFPNQAWRILDAGTDEINEKFDIVFSNAAIQWIPDHPKLLKKFHHFLSEEGVLAIQIPMFWDMRIGESISRISMNARWSSVMQGATDALTIHKYSFYYDKLSELYHSIAIWESDYIRILDSHSSILEMIQSTGLRPFLERLESDEDKRDFEEMVLKEIINEYPSQKNGKVLFPFKRLFFIARK
jgi:trans-aconitate 2-methyltransferase